MARPHSDSNFETSYVAIYPSRRIKGSESEEAVRVTVEVRQRPTYDDPYGSTGMIVGRCMYKGKEYGTHLSASSDVLTDPEYLQHATKDLCNRLEDEIIRNNILTWTL